MLFYTVSLGESSGFNYLFKIPKEIEQYAHLDKWKAFGLEPEKGKKDINPLLKHAALLYPDTLLKLNSIRELSGISYADAYDIHRAQQITACPLPTLEDAAWMRK